MLKNDTLPVWSVAANSVEFIARIRTKISAIRLHYKVKATEDCLDPNGVILNKVQGHRMLTVVTQQ